MKPRKQVEKYIVGKLSAILQSSKGHEEKASLACRLAHPEAMFEFLELASAQGAKASTLSQLQKEYQAFFLDLLAKYGVSSPLDLDDKKKQEFFKEIRDKWATGDGVSKDTTTVDPKGDGKEGGKETAAPLTTAGEQSASSANDAKRKAASSFHKELKTKLAAGAKNNKELWRIRFLHGDIKDDPQLRYAGSGVYYSMKEAKKALGLALARKGRGRLSWSKKAKRSVGPRDLAQKALAWEWTPAGGGERLEGWVQTDPVTTSGVPRETTAGDIGLPSAQ